MSQEQSSTSVQSSQAERIAILNRRFIDYMISLNFARGQFMTDEGIAEDNEEAARELLAVEQKRRAEKAKKTAVQEKVRQDVEVRFQRRLFREVDRRLQDQAAIRDRVLMLPENGPALIDALFSPATTSKKVELLSQGLDWLQVGMVKIVNMPPFADPNDSKRARITNYRGALNFVGAEDIKVIAPALSMQNWLPPAEPPFVLLRRKLWQHVMGTGIVAQRLAELDETLDPAIAFCSGIFHEMGKVVLSRLYLNVFEDVRQGMLKDLRNETTSARYNALVQIEPDQQVLRDLMVKKEREVTRLLFESFAMQRLRLADIYQEFEGAVSAEGLSGYARLLYQANAYSEFKMLHHANLASVEDGKTMFAAARLSGKTILELRKLNLKKLILTRNRVEHS